MRETHILSVSPWRQRTGSCWCEL